jgi:hypothetical protein
MIITFQQIILHRIQCLRQLADLLLLPSAAPLQEQLH